MKTRSDYARCRSVRLAALHGLSVLPLMAVLGAAGGAWAGGPAGGVVTSGSATISTPSGSRTVIDQTSGKAIIDWSSFSIGQGRSVRFNNGSGATLNRVTGGSVSSLDGLLSASGSVYLLNPNGVIIGKTGVVKVGGSFVASTLDVADSQFLAGGPLTFTGSSAAGVVNYGKVGALGGDVALIAAAVDNEGQVAAANGAAGLIAGYRVTLTDGSLDQGRFSVQLGGASTSVVNAGAVKAALVELRANGGNIYALAGNAGGVIQATGVAAGGGKVFLVAEGGTLDVEGDITTRGANGAGGQIETSASTVKIGAARIDAGPGGFWLLDPNDITIDQTAANTIIASLNGGTSVTEQTTAGGTGGSGDITLAANASIHWSTSADLTFSAYRNIVFGAGSTIDASGTGTVTLYADNTGTGVGTVRFGAGSAVTASAVSIYYDPSVNPVGSGVNGSSYANQTEDFSSNVHGALTTYFLVNTVYDLQNITNNLSANYALGRDIDASVTASWNSPEGTFVGFAPIGDPNNAFSGIFDGLGHTISNLDIDLSLGGPNGRSSSDVGLFGQTQLATLRNLNLVNVAVEGASSVGGLVGLASGGSITGVSVSGQVSSVGGNGAALGQLTGIGGLVGYDAGVQITSARSATSVFAPEGNFVGDLVGISTSFSNNNVTYNPSIADSTANGAVLGNDYVGGLVGLNSGSIQSSSASGSVSYAGVQPICCSPTLMGFDFGGLVGLNAGSISSSEATGAVSGLTNAGGLVGSNSGTISQSYFAGNTVSGDVQVGGLVGINTGAISQSYAANGAVTVACQGNPCVAYEAANNFGGLVGQNADNSVSQSYADRMYIDAAYIPPASILPVGNPPGQVITADGVGGLVGLNEATIRQSWAASEIYTVIGRQPGSDGILTPSAIGGFVAENSGTISQSYSLSRIDVYYSGQPTSVDIGGFVGLNDSLITESYSASSFNNLIVGGPSTITAAGYGGFVGYNQPPIIESHFVEEGIITDSYWDSTVAGVANSPGGGVALTTTQLQAQLPSGFSTSAWGQIPGLTYPYFLWQYPTAPDVISGTVSIARGGGALANATIDALVNGASAGSYYAGASGYYQILLPSGSIPSNASILTFITDGQLGNAFADYVTGAALSPGAYTGMNIYVNALDAQTSTGSLSSFGENFSKGLGTYSGRDFLFTVQNGVFTPTPGAGLYLTASGPFTVDQTLSLGTAPLSITAGGTFYENAALSGGMVTLATTSGDLSIGAPLTGAYSVALNSAGGLSEWGSGTITAADFSGSANGTVWLAGANMIYALTGFTNTGSGGFGLSDTASLVVTGVVDTGSGQLWLTDNHYVVFSAPAVSGGVGFVVGDDGVQINAGLSAAGGLSIYTGNGGVNEGVGGTITAPSFVSATSGVTYLPGANLIGSLGANTATGGFFLNNAQALTIEGPLSAGSVTLGTTSGTMTANGAITSGGTIYLYANDVLTLGASLSTPGDIDLFSLTRDIVLKAALSGSRSVNIDSAGATYALPGGSISTALLNVTAGSGIDLNGPNSIGSIGTDHTGSGPNQINH